MPTVTAPPAVAMPTVAVPPTVAALPAAAALPPGNVAAARWHDHTSSAEDRRQFRASLGWRYDAAAQYVARLLSDRPGLRTADDDGLAADLAAVQFFANAGDHDLLRTLRTTAQSGSPTPLLSCLVGGLRRLPALVGPVLRGGTADPHELVAYRPGTEFVEPGPLLALTDVATPLSGNAEVLIWSTSARQLQGLTDPTAATAVMFLPGTTLQVLGRGEGGGRGDGDGGRDGRAPDQILMAEVPAGWRNQPDPARDERITKRLRSFAAARATARPPADAVPDCGWATPWLAPMPGLASVRPGLGGSL